MNFFISILLACFLILLVHFIEYKRFRPYQLPDYLFLFLFLSCAYLLPPVHHVGVWIGFLPLLYCVLDDLHTKTGFTVLPFVSLIIFLILSFNWLSLFLSFAFFLFFYVAARWSNESIVGSGDSFFLLPLAYLIGINAPLGVLISATLAGAVMSLVRWFQRDITFPFFPFLFVGCFLTYIHWYEWEILLTSSSLFLLNTLLFFLFSHFKQK